MLMNENGDNADPDRKHDRMDKELPSSTQSRAESCQYRQRPKQKQSYQTDQANGLRVNFPNAQNSAPRDSLPSDSLARTRSTSNRIENTIAWRRSSPNS